MSSPLETLTAQVTQHTLRLQKLLGASNAPDPSFAPSSHNRYANESLALRTARQDLARSAKDLARLAESPEDHILSLAWSSADTANLSVILRFNLAQLVPDDGVISAGDLAGKANLPEDIVTRTLRYAIGNGIFCEPQVGVFAHNASSLLLSKNEHLRNIAIMGTAELSKILLRLPDALEQQQQTPPEKGGPIAAFNVTYPDFANVFEMLGKDPEGALRYHKYMTGRHNMQRWTIGHMVGAWDWGSVGGGTIVDAGGSSGHTALALGEACPTAKFIIQDVDPVALDEGRKTVQKARPNDAAKFDFQVHDLFKPQPVSADVYIFRHIFHDWSDEDTVKMLKNLVPGLQNGAKVLVSEGIVPLDAARTANTLDEKQILVEDEFMMAVHGARERTITDFIRLFQRADARLKYVRTTGGKNGAFQSLLEFRFEDYFSGKANQSYGKSAGMNGTPVSLVNGTGGH